MWPFNRKKKQVEEDPATRAIRNLARHLEQQRINRKPARIKELVGEILFLPAIAGEEYRTWEWFGGENPENHHYRQFGPYRIQTHGGQPFRIYRNDILVFYNDENLAADDWLDDFLQQFQADIDTWKARHKQWIIDQKDNILVRPQPERVTNVSPSSSESPSVNYVNEQVRSREVEVPIKPPSKPEVQLNEKPQEAGGMNTKRNLEEI